MYTHADQESIEKASDIFKGTISGGINENFRRGRQRMILLNQLWLCAAEHKVRP